MSSIVVNLKGPTVFSIFWVPRFCPRRFFEHFSVHGGSLWDNDNGFLRWIKDRNQSMSSPAPTGSWRNWHIDILPEWEEGRKGGATRWCPCRRQECHRRVRPVKDNPSLMYSSLPKSWQKKVLSTPCVRSRPPQNWDSTLFLCVWVSGTNGLDQ